MRARRALAAAAAAALLAAARASLDRLQPFRRECFPAVPCVMVLDADGSYGCGQCTQDSISEEVSEIVQGRALTNFLDGSSLRRFLLIPQIIFFKPEFLNSLQFKFESIAGMIVYDDFPAEDDQLDGDEGQQLLDVSTDRSNPNIAFSLPRLPEPSPFAYNNNSGGVATPAQFRFYPFNIFRVNATVAARIRERVQQFAPDGNQNKTANTDLATGTAADSSRGGMSPTYVLQSNGRMYACPENATDQVEVLDENSEQGPPQGFVLKNSAQCLEDLTCFPIGGQSVWSSLGRLATPDAGAGRQVLAVTAPMDSTAFFHGVAQGAAAEISSLATLMAVAEAVGDWRRGPGKNAVMQRQPVYFAWNAQSWGFAGSSRFLKDVLEFTCEERGDGQVRGCKAPFKSSLKFQDFKGVNWAVLNINSIITPARTLSEEPVPVDDSVPSFYMHGNNTKDSGETVEIRETLSDVFRDSIDDASIGFRLPDATQSFAQLLPGVEAVSVANFEAEFTNRAYHSEFDNVSRIAKSRRQPLYTAADGLAKTIISMCFGQEPASLDLEVKEATIDGFIQCFTSNWSAVDCELSREYQGDLAFKRGQQAVRSGNYAGVFVPEPREDLNPSQAFKTGLVRKFLMYQNRVEEGPATCVKSTDPDGIDAFDDKACNSYSDELNDGAIRDKNESAFLPVECVRGKCIASDTYRHDAFGTGIDPTSLYGADRTTENQDEPQFKVNEDGAQDEKNARGFEVPQFTESHWDPELGVCGLTEDSSLFGYSILFGGVGINFISLIVAWFLNSCLKDKDKDDTDPDEERVPIAV